MATVKRITGRPELILTGILLKVREWRQHRPGLWGRQYFENLSRSASRNYVGVVGSYRKLAN